ncbi:hypothetical protein [Streptomyces oceani]|uniref:hypothetical protein n=1 Tax=Streptomyces oceani TaxID=1075402 RepID=UPI0008724FFB|nr:hypothetical protein [Streptomyces oceani]
MTATAFTVHALLVGSVMTGGCGYGLYASWAWMNDAAPGDNRTIGGVFALFLCVLGLATGLTILRSGCLMLRGRARSHTGAIATYFPLLSVPAIALPNGILSWDPGSDSWTTQMRGFGLALVVLLSGILLGRAKATLEYFGHPPRGGGPAGRRPAPRG